MRVVTSGDARQVARSRRAIESIGWTIADQPVADGAPWTAWLRAGVWWDAPPPLPAQRSDGRAVVLIAAARPVAGAETHADDDALQAWFDATGGDGRRGRPTGLPAAALLDAAAVRCWLAAGGAMQPDAALRAILADPTVRLAAHPDATPWWDGRFRTVQVITSLQRGGAERIALALHEGLPRHGIGTGLVLTGRPVRAAFATPAGTRCVAGAADRWTAAATAAIGLGADSVLAHLIGGEGLDALRRAGLPVATTLHNATQAWPVGIAGRADVLAIACAPAVADEARATGLRVRTVRNGIAAPQTIQDRSAARTAVGVPDDGLLLLAVANPRPQKRLERLPAIAEAVQTVLRRPVHLAILGAGGSGPGATEAETALAAACSTTRVVIHRPGAVDDVTTWMAAADCLLSPSRWEGFSLVHLEALAVGLPVVATAVGAADDLAAMTSHLTTIAVDADDATWVTAIATALRLDQTPALPPACTAEAMCAAYARLVRRAAPPRTGTGLWLVTNNLFTGGAQSSARRLLTTLHGRGVAVRAAVFQELPDQPSAGRAALLSAGIPVHAVPPSDDLVPGCLALAEAMDADPPAAVLHWNLMPRAKTLLAELLTVPRLIDVSPGDMNLESLHRFFAAPPADATTRSLTTYASLLHAVVVKHPGEVAAASAAFGRPAVVVRNGVPLPPASPPRQPDGLLRLGTAARLSPQKRIEDLFEALRLAAPALPPWRLCIAGGPDGADTTYAEHLRRSACDLPIDWLGDCDDATHLEALDLFILIAEPPGCPNASLEAMARGLPVIATRVGGIPDQLGDGAGVVVPPRDARALAEAIIALAGDPARRRALGDAARQRIADRFSLDAMADGYLSTAGLTNWGAWQG